MRGELNRQTAIAGEMKIRMVVFGFGNDGDALNQANRRQKIFARDLPA